jgi:hypothetical protein
MSYHIARFADMLEEISDADFTAAPHVKFMNAVKVVLQNDFGIEEDFATRLLLRSKIEINAFDWNDNNWKRVVKAYAKMIGKMYLMYGENLIEAADKLSIKYED